MYVNIDIPRTTIIPLDSAVKWWIVLNNFIWALEYSTQAFSCNLNNFTLHVLLFKVAEVVKTLLCMCANSWNQFPCDLLLIDALHFHIHIHTQIKMKKKFCNEIFQIKKCDKEVISIVGYWNVMEITGTISHFNSKIRHYRFCN